MGYSRFLIPEDATDVGSSTMVATTAGTTILVPSTATGGIYLTGFFINCGTASTVQIGFGVGAVAPTTTAIKVQPINIAANSSVYVPLYQPIAIPSSRNVLITVAGGATSSAVATYYVAP